MELSPIMLPYGKIYHVFLSFSQEDEERVFSLLQELEDKYQLRCLYHIRDFQPGVTITENILDGIEKSMKIAYFVSQKFKDSEMCKMEVLYGVMASHKQCGNSMIPILLESIEMPRELQTINYVDGTLEGTDVASKIYNACLFGATENCILPNVIPFHGLTNGTLLRVIRRKDRNSFCLPLTHFSEDMEKRQKIDDEIRSRQIDELCNEIVEELNASRYTTRYFLYNSAFWGRLWCFLVLGTPALAMLPLLIFLVKEGEIKEQTLAGACSTLVIVPLVAVSIVVCCCFGKNMIKGGTLLKKIAWKHLRNNYQTLKVLPLVRSTEEIVFINYDTDPCKNFCVCVLKQKMEDEEEIQKKADSMILDFIYKHRLVLAHWHGLEDFKYNRHNTYFQKKCICQYLEPRLVSDSIL